MDTKPKSQAMNAKIGKLDFSEVKTSALWKTLIWECGDNSDTGENISKHVSDKVLGSKVNKERLKPKKKKKQTTQLKHAQTIWTGTSAKKWHRWKVNIKYHRGS